MPNVYGVISSEMVSRALYTAHRSVDYINLGHVKVAIVPSTMNRGVCSQPWSYARCMPADLPGFLPGRYNSGLVEDKTPSYV